LNYGKAGVDLRDAVAAGRGFGRNKGRDRHFENGRTARITMHLIEGSKEEIEATFHQSVQAFFEMYPEI